MIQLAIVAVGAILIWATRAQRNRNLWRENWGSVFYVALAIATFIVGRIESSSFEVADLVYSLIGLALYIAFVYAWNRSESREPEHE